MKITLNNGTIITDSTIDSNEQTYFVHTGLNSRYMTDKLVAKEIISPQQLWELGNFENLCVIGITGTNGKTTTSALIYSLLLDLGEKVALQGTRGFFINGEKVETKTLTTPDVLPTFSHIYQAYNAGCRYFVMEVSSHAIAQGRSEGISFSIKGITNITQDHLDFHKTFEEYRNVKNSFISDEILKVVNIDDKEMAYNPKNSYSYGLDNPCAFKIESYTLNDGVSGVIRFGTQTAVFHSDLHGVFNLYNIALAIGIVTLISKKGIEEVCECVEGFGGVEGRMEKVSDEPLVIVDFAHTPDGIYRVLESMKNHSLVVVFGAGGDRDPLKRPLMGKIATHMAKKVIITSDNPRSEDPLAIMAQIFSGVEENNKEKVVSIEDRKEAIAYALSLLEKGDILLILGKGDETTQIFHDKTVVFDDREIVRELLKK